ACNALALEGLGEHCSGLVCHQGSVCEGLAEGFHIVPIHHIRVETAHQIRLPGLVDVHLVLEGGGLALSQPVDVEDGHQIVEVVVARKRQRLPDGALRRLPIPNHAVHTVAARQFSADYPVGASPGFVEVLADVGHAGGAAQPLPERPGGHVNEVEAGRRVPFQVVVDLAQVEELLHGKEASLCPGGVEDRCGVALHQDKTVARGVPGDVYAVTHGVEEQHRHDLCHGTA
ncbi:unnamed protein product, partial [Ixodes hexagonus]